MKTKNRIIRSILVPLTALCLGMNLSAQPASIADLFLYKEYVDGVHTIPYRLFIPEDYDENILYPVMLTLHTSYGCGTDNNAQLMEGKVATIWADPGNQAEHPCIVVSPQLPCGVSFTSSPYSEFVMNILDTVINTYSIDTNRQYVTGISLGSFGAWGFIGEYPERFAAAIPMSGGQAVPDADLCKNVSIWAFHAQGDGVVGVASTRSAVNKVAQADRSVVYTHQYYRERINLSDDALLSQVESHSDLLYTEYEGMSHFIWEYSYRRPLLIKWVFDQYRCLRDTNAIRISNFNQYKRISGTDTLKWESNYPDHNVEIWFSSNDGRSWQEVSHTKDNDGIFLFNTEDYEDCAVGLIKILLKDEDEHVLSYSLSENFAINNSENGEPFLHLSSLITKTATIREDSIYLNMKIGDPESDILSVEIFYQPDTETGDILCESFTFDPDTIELKRLFTLYDKEYATEAVIKVVVSDGEHSVTRSTPTFKNSNGIGHPEAAELKTGKKITTSVYPNPTYGPITINLDEPPENELMTSIYNSQGQLILMRSFQNNSKADINLTDLPDGMFLLEIIVDGIIERQKVLLTR